MRLICIAVLLIGALLCVATVGAVKPTQDPISKIVLIHYKDRVESMGASATDTVNNDYYEFLTYQGHKLNWGAFPVKYYVNPKNSYGLKSNKVTETIRAAFDAWDAKTATGLFSYGGTTTSSPDPTKYVTINGENPLDYINVVSWWPMGDSGAIAVTTVWFETPTEETPPDAALRIVQSDIVMNSAFPWGIDADGEGSRLLKNRFDIRNIITHEAGHVCGLGDLYPISSVLDPYRQLTMYGIGSYGEVQKISLENGDIKGLQFLYGA